MIFACVAIYNDYLRTGYHTCDLPHGHAGMHRCRCGPNVVFLWW